MRYADAAATQGRRDSAPDCNCAFAAERECLRRLKGWEPPALQTYDIVIRLAEAEERRNNAIAIRKVSADATK